MSDTDSIVKDIEDSSDYAMACTKLGEPAVGYLICNIPDLEPREKWSTMLIAPSDRSKNTDICGFKRKYVVSSKADEDPDDNGHLDTSRLELDSE
jgi:hypothetical protein